MIDEKELIEELKNEFSEYKDWIKNNFDGPLYGIEDMFKDLLEIVQGQPKVGEWIPVEERLPEEDELIDDETGYYNKSDNVLCCGKNEYNEVEYWIDYTIDGEWQCSEYVTGDEMYWRPLPKPYKEVIK